MRSLGLNSWEHFAQFLNLALFWAGIIFALGLVFLYFLGHFD